MRQLLYKLPLMPLLVAAIFLGLAPFQPEPHLWTKLKMLADGSLTEMIDIFDMLMHGAPLILLVLKFILGKAPEQAES